MNGSSEDLLRGTVNAYSNYLDASGSGSKGWGVTGSQSQFNVIEDGIEDLEIKITEFERLMDLLEIWKKFFDRIDRLDVMVSIVREDLQRTDKQLAQAESTIEGGLRSFVPAFISSKFTVQEPTSPTETVYEEPPKLFSTEDFFKD
ncbi:unnamed protein product [Lepeophtheirus salmonis]|uniref:(salmon louse) hypothetical protein n=1 Tax=Lepeophtheirus salmonis TaxID=72036 RepID=A0A7R8H9T7_LEPSM|nr:unnamed protein product [Lepeophtheirus salmonis]CAF2954973.1 unnamed protein product [Lepeophtheirus salmonis]